MLPDEYAKLRDEIKDVIVHWCEEAGVDPTQPAEVSACSRHIWNALEESGKLHPQMSYEHFNAAIFLEGMRSDFSKMGVGI